MTKNNKNNTKYIELIGAKLHNLKNISIKIPKNKLIVISGVSGSGKSSLAFDTLFAEGQRVYIESLSSYARQFLGKLQKPDIDDILGICPAIAIEQKTTTNNARSTIGTSTEIYDYLKLLFARIGKTYSPISGEEVRRHQISDVVDFIKTQKNGTPILILARNKEKEGNILTTLKQQGFSRVYFDGSIHKIETLINNNTNIKKEISIIIDRIIIDGIDNEARISDSVQTAFFEGNGRCDLINLDNPVSDNPRSLMNSILSFSSNCEISDSIRVEMYIIWLLELPIFFSTSLVNLFPPIKSFSETLHTKSSGFDVIKNNFFPSSVNVTPLACLFITEIE